MERWSELIAGHVLGNLTDEEHQELSEVLREQPQLHLEIARLRKTATMSHAQAPEWSNEKLEAGAEGWTDTVQRLPDQQTADSSPVQPAFPEHEQLVAAVIDSANAESGQRVIAAASRPQFWPFRWVSPGDTFLQRTNLLTWVIALLLVGVGIDNWRVRRLLAIAEQRILQLEHSAEYSSGQTK